MLVAAERAGPGLDAVIGDDDDVVIAAVTAAELLVGVELADRRRASRGAFVEAVLGTVPVEPYDLEVARHHAGCSPTAAARGGCAALTIFRSPRPRSPGGGRSSPPTPRAFADLPGCEVRIAGGGG